jgi:hypothetical protein
MKVIIYNTVASDIVVTVECSMIRQSFMPSVCLSLAEGSSSYYFLLSNVVDFDTTSYNAYQYGKSSSSSSLSSIDRLLWYTVQDYDVPSRGGATKLTLGPCENLVSFELSLRRVICALFVQLNTRTVLQWLMLAAISVKLDHYKIQRMEPFRSPV